MKAYEIVGYTDPDGYTYCANCGSEDMTPIFADTEFDYTVFCAMCGEPLEVNVILERKKPEGVPQSCWEEFEAYANANGIGKEEDDWLEWFECFKAGWDAAKHERF